jgi:dCTP diphosphatase
MSNELNLLRDDIRKFAEERDWDQFHSPKNLAAALVVEAAELLENFQWLTEEESKNLSEDKQARVKAELSDVFIYLIRLADKLNVELISAANEKIVSNAEKYPIAKAKGNANKYNEL